MNWLKQNWIKVGIALLISGIFALVGGGYKWGKNTSDITSPDDTILKDIDKKWEQFSWKEEILSHKPEELNNEQICINIGYLLVGYCGSGGCSLSQPLEDWIDKARSTLRLRGVTAYEYKDSDIDCSEAVIERIENNMKQ